MDYYQKNAGGVPAANSNRYDYSQQSSGYGQQRNFPKKEKSGAGWWGGNVGGSGPASSYDSQNYSEGNYQKYSGQYSSLNNMNQNQYSNYAGDNSGKMGIASSQYGNRGTSNPQQYSGPDNRFNEDYSQYSYQEENYDSSNYNQEEYYSEGTEQTYYTEETEQNYYTVQQNQQQQPFKQNNFSESKFATPSFTGTNQSTWRQQSFNNKGNSRGRGRDQGGRYSRGSFNNKQNSFKPKSFEVKDIPIPPKSAIGCNTQDQDVEMAQPAQPVDTANGTGAKLKPWEKPAFRRIKKKNDQASKNMRNLRMKKLVQPKNAVMCLNELRPGLEYKVEQESGGIGQPTCISVEVDGQSYRGYGSSKILAKQAAAEAALISFVKPPVTKDTEEDEDKTPWATLASFAVYKLFNDWREGRVGMCSAPASQPFANPVTNQAFTGFATPQIPPAAPTVAATPPKAMESMNVAAHLEDGRQQCDGKYVPNRAKTLPENANGMNPIMLLHQMRPEIKYSHTQETRDGKPFFIVTGLIDNVPYKGEGTSVKKAKLEMAKIANQQIFGLATTYAGTGVFN